MGGRLVGSGETVRLAADPVFKAIGQTFEDDLLEGAMVAVSRLTRRDARRLRACGPGAIAWWGERISL